MKFHETRKRVSTFLLTSILAVTQTLGLTTPAYATDDSGVSITAESTGCQIFQWVDDGSIPTWLSPACFHIFSDGTSDDYVCIDVAANFDDGSHRAADLLGWQTTYDGHVSNAWTQEDIDKCALAVRWAEDNFAGNDMYITRQYLIWNIAKKAGVMYGRYDWRGVQGKEDEVKANYRAFNDWYEAHKDEYSCSGVAYYLEGSDTSQVVARFSSVPRTGNVAVSKRSANPSLTDGNRMYSLEGAEFQVIDEDGNVVDTLRTDRDGDTGKSKDLPIGTYTIHESKAPEGYSTSDDTSLTISCAGQTAIAEVSEQPLHGPADISITKRDVATGDTPQGSATLAGAEFTVEYYDTIAYDTADALLASGESPLHSWTVTTDEDGNASLGAACADTYQGEADGNGILPLGTIVVKETKAPKGYTLGDNPISMRKIGADATPASHDPITMSDDVIRGDLEFEKLDGIIGDAMAGIPFKVTSKSTGECHVIVTDGDGRFSSASNRHSNNTNGNDDAVAAANGAAVDSSTLDATAGTWFGAGEADDSKAAFPYDTYTIEELPCTNNARHDLIATTFTVDGTTAGPNLGTLTDTMPNPPSIRTTAADGIDGDKDVIRDTEMTIVDTVSYTNLDTTKEYTIRGTLMDKATGKPLAIDGKPVTAETKLMPEKSDGKAQVTLKFDGTSLKDGQRLVAFEDLSRDGKTVATHADIDDDGQSVTVLASSIRTTATDKADGDHTIAPSKTATVVDTISYENLIAGKEYTVKGTLMDKETGKAFEVDGKPVTASTTFTPEKADGTVDVTLAFDASALGGHDLVAFEELHEQQADAEGNVTDVTVAEHKDIEDKDQTVTVSKSPQGSERPSGGTYGKTGLDMTATAVTVTVLAALGAAAAAYARKERIS